MIKKISIALLATVAATVATIGANKMLNEVYILNDQVTETSITPLVQDLTNDPTLLEKVMTTRIIINSPGGSVNQLDFLKAVRDTSHRKIQTELPKFAASAAADIFLIGDTRLMAKHAEILFHEVRRMLGGGIFGGGVMVTFTDLKEIHESGKLGPNSDHEGKEKEIVELVRTTFTEKELTEIVEKLQESHDGHVEFLMERLDMKKSEVLEKLLIPNVDVTLTHDEAIELRVATGTL